MTNFGQIAATSGAIEALETTGDHPARFIRQHVRGDWGNVCEEGADDTKIWIITEADRSATTVLLPSEY